jgi:hypothetical protein
MKKDGEKERKKISKSTARRRGKGGGTKDNVNLGQDSPTALSPWGLDPFSIDSYSSAGSSDTRACIPLPTATIARFFPPSRSRGGKASPRQRPRVNCPLRLSLSLHAPAASLPLRRARSLLFSIPLPVLCIEAGRGGRGTDSSVNQLVARVHRAHVATRPLYSAERLAPVSHSSPITSAPGRSSGGAPPINKYCVVYSWVI